MRLIGITGGIGSGKSTISNYLKKKGYPVHDSDAEVSQLYKKPNKFFSKPNYYYLYKPEKVKIKLKHKYDVVLMTTFSIKKLFGNKFISNITESIDSMEIVFACHASDETQNTIHFPLNKKFYKKKINFA